MSLEIQRIAVVVDDDLVYLQTVGLMLKKLGFNDIKLFSNPIDALSYIETTQIDLIVSDWDMPLMTGHEFLEKFVKIQKLTLFHLFLTLTIAQSLIGVKR